jgi:hypothetical protein
MAEAPTPGAVDRAASNHQPIGRFEMTLGGTTLQLPVPLPFKEKFAVRAATGLPFEQFWSGELKIAEDSFLIIWWLARRFDGEPNLPLSRVMEDWPDDIKAAGLSLDFIKDDGDEETDDPES